MTVRLATSADTARIVAMVEHFLESSIYGRQIVRDPERLAWTTEIVLERGVIFVAEIAGVVEGFLAGGEQEHPYDGARVAVEFAWWVEPAHRGSSIGPRLLRAFEDWARQKGLSYVTMVAPAESGDVSRYYLKTGYAPLETSYVKRVC